MPASLVAPRFAPRLIRALSGAAVVAVLAGCEPVITTHGYAPPDEMLTSIREGVDTRGSVRRKIGRPGTTGAFSEEGWYYVATTVSKRAFYAPEVVERKVIAVTFNDRDVVQSVNRYGLEDGLVVDLETRTTPTFGQELTILQQLLGNIGELGDTLGGNN